MNDQLIDRLVAGDLDEGRRRELLDWLDAEPGRWRCCALAFLEAQLWQETFDVVVRRSQDQSGLFGVTPPAAPGRRTWPSLRPISAVAAALLVAFGLGLSAGWLSRWSRAIGPPALSVAHHPDSATVDDQSGRLLSNAVRKDPVTTDEVGSASLSLVQGDSGASYVQTFAVLKVATESAGTREIHLPVLEGPASNERWLRPDPEALPEYVQKQLERCGYQLQQRRRFLEVQLEDGRHAVIPVDQYQVTFVGSQSS